MQPSVNPTIKMSKSAYETLRISLGEIVNLRCMLGCGSV
jgi:hypothetical protein